MYTESLFPAPRPPSCASRAPSLRGCRNTVEIMLFEISNSMKPYPFCFHARTHKSKPLIGIVEPKHLDEASNRIPPTSHLPRWPTPPRLADSLAMARPPLGFGKPGARRGVFWWHWRNSEGSKPSPMQTHPKVLTPCRMPLANLARKGGGNKGVHV